VGLRNRAFRRFRGAVTPRRWRFLVLWRYGRREVFASRIVTGLYALTFAPLLVAAILIYLRHNVPALAAMDLETADLLSIDATFFGTFLRLQAGLAFLLTALVGPGLVSPDLAHNGLALYLSRPLSRAEYVLGKMTVLVALASSITWVPLLALVALQAGLEPAWLGENLRIPWALFAGSWLWILFLSLLALAISAWIRWRVVAAAMLVVVMVVGSSLGEIVNALFGTSWGDLVSPGRLVLGLWQVMLHGPELGSLASVPQPAAWVALGTMTLLCLLVLDRKLRAYEVVR
jgi:ABC-2 type transport system permease protein